MKKTKLLTSLAALALVVSLGACEVNVDVGGVDMGGVDVDVDVDSNDSSESDEGGTTDTDTDTNPGTGEGGEGDDTDTDSGSGEGGGEQTTYTYSLEVENGDSLTLTYDEALETQQGVELSIKLVTTSSTGNVTKEDGNADNLTFTISDPTVVTVSGLTVLPLSGGETSITIKWSEHDEATASVGVTVTDVTVYGPTSWADYITNEYDLGVIAGAFGDVSLDEILPFSYELLTNSSYSFQSYYVSAESFRLMYSWPSDSNGLTNAWDTLLTDFGYVKVSSETSGLYTTVTYTLDGGYTVEIKYSTVGDWDLYLYPPEPEPEPITSWNEYITNDYDRGQIASLLGSVDVLDELLPFYLGDTNPTVTTGSSVSGQRLIITYNTATSTTLSTWVSLLEADGWEQTGHETSYNEVYTFTKDGYTVEVNLEFGSLYLYLYPKAEEPEPAAPTSWAEFINNDYDLGVLYDTLGTDIDNVLPFYYEETGYSGYYAVSGVRFYLSYYYPSNTLTDGWIAALTEFGYIFESSTSNNFGGTTYVYLYNGYEVEIITSSFGEWTLNLYPPVEEADEDLETAQAILNAVQGATPNWTAFYADVTKDDDDAYKEYLTTDGDGNLYGYRYDWDDWEEVGSEFWYYGGYKCMYSYDGTQAQTPGEVYTTFEDELEALTYSLTISFNLASDPYTLTEVDGGYELTVAKSTTSYNTYTFTVDASYNLLAIDTDAQIGSQSDEIALGHVEGITYADVEAFIATTNFNPDDFFGEQEDNPLAAVAGSYIGTSNAGASLTLELYEDGTGLYDGNTAITWTFDGTNVYFEINYGDPVNLVWDAEAQTLTGTWLQDYEYDIYLSFTKVESCDGDTQEEVINLVGTWTGQGTYSNTYTVTIYADGTYKLVLPSAEYTGTWTGSLDGTIELDVSSTVLEYFKLTYNATNDTALVDFEDDDYNDYTNVVYTRAG